MAITFNPTVSFQSRRQSYVSDADLGSDAVRPEMPNVQASPIEKQKVSPLRGAFSDIAKFFVSTSEMTQATIKAIAYGFVTGTAVAAYKWATKAIPAAFKEGGSIVETLKHPAKSIGWKGNLLAGVAALGVASYNLVRGKLRTNQRTANVDHQLYTGHRDI